MKGKYVIMTFVCLVFGYMISFSYHLTRTEQNDHSNMTSSQFARDLELRTEIIEQEEKNQKLQKELYQKQTQVLNIEKELSNEAQLYSNLAEDAEKYQDASWKSKGKGKGSTSDSS